MQLEKGILIWLTDVYTTIGIEHYLLKQHNIFKNLNLTVIKWKPTYQTTHI